MDQETRDLLIRIDERTKTIHDGQSAIITRFEKHEHQDREDFHEVFKRINALERRQNWILGVGTTIAFFVGLLAAWLKSSLGL